MIKKKLAQFLEILFACVIGISLTLLVLFLYAYLGVLANVILSLFGLSVF